MNFKRQKAKKFRLNGSQQRVTINMDVSNSKRPKISVSHLCNYVNADESANAIHALNKGEIDQEEGQHLAEEIKLFEQLQEYRRFHANAGQPMTPLSTEGESLKMEYELAVQYEKVQSLQNMKMQAEQMEVMMFETELRDIDLKLSESCGKLKNKNNDRKMEAFNHIMTKVEKDRQQAESFILTVNGLQEGLQTTIGAVEAKKEAYELIGAIDDLKQQFLMLKQGNAKIGAKEACRKELTKKEQQCNVKIMATGKQWDQVTQAYDAILAEFEAAAASGSQNVFIKFDQLMANCEGKIRESKRIVTQSQERRKIQGQIKELNEELIKLCKMQKCCEDEITRKAIGCDKAVLAIKGTIAKIDEAAAGLAKLDEPESK